MSAAAQSGRNVETTRIRNAVNAPAAQSATIPAPPNIPSPGAAVRPFSAISAFARSISWRRRSERSAVRLLATSPIGRSRKSFSVWFSIAMTPVLGLRGAGRRLRRRVPRLAQRAVVVVTLLRRCLHEACRCDAGQETYSRQHPRPPPGEPLDVTHDVVAAHTLQIAADPL